MQIGDVVSAKGVQYLMTVRSINGNIITCNYFDNNCELHEEEFEIVRLTII